MKYKDFLLKYHKTELVLSILFIIFFSIIWYKLLDDGIENYPMFWNIVLFVISVGATGGMILQPYLTWRKLIKIDYFKKHNKDELNKDKK